MDGFPGGGDTPSSKVPSIRVDWGWNAAAARMASGFAPVGKRRSLSLELEGRADTGLVGAFDAGADAGRRLVVLPVTCTGAAAPDE
mgnify:FL=1